MKVRQIAIDFFSERERQMTSNYLAMLVMFAHLAIKERQIAINFFSERGCQVTTTIRYVCLTKQIIQKENILFMFYHIHGTFKFTEYSVYVSSHICEFKFREFGAAASNPWQPITNCRMYAERSVTEDAIEGNSWGKSECEWICCVPNTKRLYHSSVDAPLETHHNTHNTTWQPKSNWGVFAGRSTEEDAVGRNTHPPWCHVSKSNSLLSRRTQVAANAYKDKPHKSARHTTKHKRGVNADRKWYKQTKYLKDVQVCNVASNKRVQYMSSDYIRKNILVCDGGDTTSDAIKIHRFLKVIYKDLKCVVIVVVVIFDVVVIVVVIVAIVVVADVIVVVFAVVLVVVIVVAIFVIVIVVIGGVTMELPRVVSKGTSDVTASGEGYDETLHSSMQTFWDML